MTRSIYALIQAATNLTYCSTCGWWTKPHCGH